MSFIKYFVYSSDFKKRYIVPALISIEIVVKYNDIGTINAILPLTKNNNDIIDVNSIFLETKGFNTFIIKNKKIDTVNNQIIVNGYTTNSILNERIILNKRHFKNVETDVYNLINENLRGLPHIKTAPLKGLTDTIDSTILDGQLLNKIIYLLNRAGMGHRMIWDDSKKMLSFEIYKGDDLTEGIHAAVFSYEWGTAKNLIISNDISNFKTTYYISGITTDEKRIIEVIGDENQNENRLEKWVRDVPKQEQGTTEEEFRQLLKEKAKETAKDYIKRQNFNVEIDSKDFTKKYKLGDIITCISNNYGVKFNSRITGYKYTLDINGEKTNLLMGDPNITIIEEARLNGND